MKQQTPLEFTFPMRIKVVLTSANDHLQKSVSFSEEVLNSSAIFFMTRMKKRIKFRKYSKFSADNENLNSFTCIHQNFTSLQPQHIAFVIGVRARVIQMVYMSKPSVQ